MTIPGIQAANSFNPPAPQAVSADSGLRPQHADGLSFDRFQRAQAEPNLRIGTLAKLTTVLFHPMECLGFIRAKKVKGSGESLFERIQMYHAVKKGLDGATRKQLKNLLKQGVLSDTDTDNRHSTLYQLYAMLKTERGHGYDGKTILKETVEVLNRPYTISQKFAPLSENAARQILQVRNNPGLNRAGVAPPAKPLQWNDLNVENSATCVSSSVMYYMADRQPGELARHLNELTSPMNAFFEKARLDEISPDDPSQALQILKDHNIKYFISGPGEVTVKVENPPAGVIRSIDSQKVTTQRGKQQFDANKNPVPNAYDGARNGIEAAYQSALTFLATRSYDPATDMRDSEVPGEGSKGLTEPEKTLMETIIKDNGGVQSVTYQAVAGKANPQPGEEANSYLYGYTRSFEQTAQDIVEALKMKEFVIIGITDTDETGAIVGGHEITITSAYVDKKDNQLKFVVADSDDGVPSLVVRNASELIPRIHHAGLPVKVARRINQEINQNQGGYFVPDQNDEASFNLLPRQEGPMPVDPAQDPNQQQAEQTTSEQTQPAQSQPQTQQPAQAQAQPAQQAGQQQVEWVPVYNYYPQQQIPYIPTPQSGALPTAWPGSGYPQATYGSYPQAGYPGYSSYPGYYPQSGYPQTQYPAQSYQPQAYAPLSYPQPAWPQTQSYPTQNAFQSSQSQLPPNAQLSSVSSPLPNLQVQQYSLPSNNFPPQQ